MTSEDERFLVVHFLRESAGKLLGEGIYADKKEHDPIAIFWMNEALELAANSIENNEHYNLFGQSFSQTQT